MVIVTRSEMRKIKAIEKKIQQDFAQKKIPTGIEICEIQLYHLANSIKQTKINKDVENYLPAINEVLEGIDREELIKKIISVEFTRFSNYYSKTKDLNTADASGSARERGSGGSSSSDGSVRYFINVGEKDGFDWMSLKDFLRDTLQLGQDDVYKVDAKETFSFFNTDPEHTDKILAFFTDFKQNGRFINVEVSKTGGGGGGGRKFKGGKRNGYKARGKREGGGGSYGDSGRNRNRSDKGNRNDARDRNRDKSKAAHAGKRRSKPSRSDFF